uniref:Uncharacterized protein n=1 Tax=Anopheles maculatus TaxID=74869 RepID=A0A182TA59_9DIPT
MSLDLPRGYDYFISCQIVQTLQNYSDVTSCEFWGIVRSLGGCAYYVLEANVRDKSVEYCQYQGVIGKHPEIITDIIDVMLEKTLHQTRSLSILPQLTAESLENLAQTMMNELIAKLQLVDKEIEEQYCRLDIGCLLTELIERLSCISSDSEDSFSAMLTDPCATSRSSVHSTASMLRIRLERIQLETRLNSRRYWVSENPRTKPWQELPDITLEQLEATEGLQVFLRGNLEAPVSQTVKKFNGVEKNLLRALICKISSHRDCHIDGSDTNISLVRCLSGVYCSVTGFSQELLQERAERWWERKEQGMQFWQSDTWPGLYTFNDGDQFRCYYNGWGLEKRSNWYCPVVRVPKMASEYEDAPIRNSDISERSKESVFNDALSKISSKDSFECSKLLK